MLTLEQFFTYESFDIVIIVGSIIFIALGLIFKLKGKDEADRAAGLMFGGLGCAILGAVALAIITTSITSITIIPCAITQGQSLYYIADTSGNVYIAEPDTVLKIHMNQSVTVDIRTGLLQHYPLIVNVTSSMCKSPESQCQPYWTHYNFSNYTPIPLGPNDTIINIPPSNFTYL